MSNKVLAFIILVIIFGGIIGGYLYLFIFYGGNIQTTGNVKDYNISLTTDIVSQSLNYTCSETECVYKDIPPLEYTVVVSKPGYTDFITYEKVPGRGTINIDFVLEKKVELTQLSQAQTKDVASLTSQKLIRLKYKNFYKYFDFGEDGVFYVREYLGKLFLYHDLGEKERLVYDFDTVPSNNIFISPVYGTDYYVISVDSGNYLFHIQNTSLRGLDLQQKIDYGKSTQKSDEIVFVTEVGSYLYSLKERKSEYYVPFLDFVYLDDGDILGLLEKDDEKRLNNFGVTLQKNNGLFRYNIATRKIKSVFETSEDIEEFYLQNETLYLVIEGITKELENY